MEPTVEQPAEYQTDMAEPPKSDHRPPLRSLFSTQVRGLDPLYTRSKRWRTTAFSSHIPWSNLDRVQVLGDEDGGGYGHTGCVNALCWSNDGQQLISSGDDCRICIWQFDASEGIQYSPSSRTESPFTCSSVIQTGHTNNIFSVQFLPYTNDGTVVTCSADKQIRVFDITRAGGITHQHGRNYWEERPQDRCCQKVLRCHKARVKRIITEDSPNLFLSVSEDQTVRQHDLRTSHHCTSGCPAPLVKLPYSLSTLSCSPLTPFYFVVAGESQFAHLFDRRMTGRVLKHEWGIALTSDDENALARCVRRFGRLKLGQHEAVGSSHITGSRMAKSNGHELLLSYSGDAAYLYSIKDQPTEKPKRQPSVLPPNHAESPKKRKAFKLGSRVRKDPLGNGDTEMSVTAESDGGNKGGNSGPPSLQSASDDSDTEDDDEEVDDDPTNINDDEEEEAEEYDPWAAERVGSNLNCPIVFPRKQFKGACNVKTVKDVNFVGPEDEWITSGSDDGYFFIWSKATGKLHGIYEGDGGVVNVVEDRPAHHSYPMLAVSGLDCTVKLFAPTPPPRSFGRMDNAEQILATNANQNLGIRRITRNDLIALYATLQASGHQIHGSAFIDGEERECSIM